MAKATCQNCGFVFWSKPEERCNVCGYHFDYIAHKAEWPISRMKRDQEMMIEIRTALCDLREQDVQNEGIIAEFTVSSQGILIKPLYKYKSGLLTTKKWTFSSPARKIVRYEDILSITQGTFQGKPASFYVYNTRTLGVLRPSFRADVGITDKYPELDREMRDLVEQFR